MKTAVLILITTFGTSSGKAPDVQTVGTFYGETSTDAVMSCRAFGSRQLKILPFEYGRGVFTRGFMCHPGWEPSK